MAEPAFGGEAEIEEDGGDDAASDEERLQTVCADVTDVGDVLQGGHGRVLRATLRQPDDEYGEQHGYKLSDVAYEALIDKDGDTPIHMAALTSGNTHTKPYLRALGKAMEGDVLFRNEA